MCPKNPRALAFALCAIVALAVTPVGCGKSNAGGAPAAAPAQTAAPASAQSRAAQSSSPASPQASGAAAATPTPAASTDVDSPTPLPAKELKGTGIKKDVTYYYTFNASPGTVRVTATAKNAPVCCVHALMFEVQNLTAKKLCGEASGNTREGKTMTVNCDVDKAQPLILRLDLSEATIDYTVALDGPIELPAAQTASAKSIAGAGSTDIDEPTHLTTNRIKGEGTGKPVTYYYSFNAGPGELTLTADGKNKPVPSVNPLIAGIYTLRSERLCETALPNSSRGIRKVVACKLDKRQPVILRLDVHSETIDFGAKFEGPYDFESFTPPKEVTIALDAAVLFDTGKWVLKPEARQTLHEAAERVKKFADAPVTISGHTDNVGSDASNQVLSEKRAAAVQQYFTSAEGIPASRLTVKGYGKSQPVADNTTEAGRARNRRVEIVISPKSR